MYVGNSSWGKRMFNVFFFRYVCIFYFLRLSFNLFFFLKCNFVLFYRVFFVYLGGREVCFFVLLVVSVDGGLFYCEEWELGEKEEGVVRVEVERLFLVCVFFWGN